MADIMKIEIEDLVKWYQRLAEVRYSALDVRHFNYQSCQKLAGGYYAGYR